MKILGKNLVGFATYHRDQVIESILDSSDAQQIFNELEQKKHQSPALSRQKAKEILLELTSSYSPMVLRLCYWIVWMLQKFMFSKISNYGEELGQIHQLTRDGKIIFYLPNHKSHMDYLLFSYILFNHHIAPPHIAAGVNLSFFPVGWIFRNTGAYFIRRKIAGNFLYTRFLQLYFDWMLKEKVSQEFYMEGGRSRDGKIRDAQSGIFTLFVEQIRSQKLENDVFLVPTSITYDKLPEMLGIRSELVGNEKQKESMLSLFHALSILWTNHQQVHIQFGKPIVLSSLLEGEFSKQKFQELSHKVFNQVQHNKIITVTSLVALVLLSTSKSIKIEEFTKRIFWLLDFLKPCRQDICEEVANMQKHFDEVVQRFEKLGWFEKIDGYLHVQSSKRMEMNYYKNDVFPQLLPLYSFVDSTTQKILLHEFAYFKLPTRTFKPDEDALEFLKKIIEPLTMFYDEVANQIGILDLKNLMNKDTHKKLLTQLIKNETFLYREMFNTESIKSACAYYHQQKKSL